MRESIGKAITREFFYKNYLPVWLSSKELQKGNFLVLLGETYLELPYIDSFGTSRSQVYSVERLSEIFQTQIEKNLGVNLMEGELLQQLRSIPYDDDNFIVFNLDTEGSYLSQLDAGMTPVLLSSWHNPKTVIATYSSIGRDTEMIWEGIKSLAIFLWVNRYRTLKTFASLIKRYRAIRFENPVFMALRDMFWLRSIMEHSLVASTITGATTLKILKRWLNKADTLWEEVSIWQRKPLRVQNLLSAIDLMSQTKEDGYLKVFELSPCIGSIIKSFKHIVYNAEKPWSQLCYFTTFEILDKPINVKEWLNYGLEMLMVCEPLIYINRAGEKRELRASSRRWKIFDTILWNKRDIYEKFKPRKINVSNIGELNQQYRKENAVKYFDEKGHLTKLGKERVQQCGRKLSSSPVSEILAFLPKPFQKIPFRTIVAHIAIGRRGLKKK